MGDKKRYQPIAHLASANTESNVCLAGSECGKMKGGYGASGRLRAEEIFDSE